ncbi:MAG TPA: hypothetical protein VLM37_03485 [Fibrobacteraceae bacterium]|nr:hypothetical protein [Fibrobacteraceae bacterium]
MNLRLIQFLGNQPLSVSIQKMPTDCPSGQSIATAFLQYANGPEETLGVTIEEYANTLDAYASWLNRGLGPEGLPRILGEYGELSTLAGRWIFRFRSPLHYVFSSETLDSLVKSFPETSGSLPSPFMTLPLRDRVVGGGSVQTGRFLGTRFEHRMLCQRYGNALGCWNVARSLDPVGEKAWNDFVGRLKSLGAKEITPQNGRAIIFRTTKERICIGLSDGILLVVWGLQDGMTLESLWKEAENTLDLL